MLYRITIIILLIFLSVSTVEAQKNERDAALWVNLYLSKKINKKYTLHLNQQNRFNNNITQYSQGYADVGVTRKLSKHFKVLLDYVFIYRRNTDQSFSIRHQYYVALITEKRVHNINYSYRIMFQGQNNMPYFIKENYPVFYLRNKATVKYQINKYFTAYVAEELFLPLNNYKVKGLDRSRSFVGFFYNTSKNSELELYFAFQDQLNPTYRRKQDYIYGLGYSIKL